MHESVLQDKTTRFSLFRVVVLVFVLLAAALWLCGNLLHPEIPLLPQPSWAWWGVLGGSTSCFLALLLLGNKSLCRIRARREKAEMLRQSWLLQTVINAIPAPIYYKDDAGIYLGCNEAFERFIGLSRDQIIGQSVYGVAPRDLADVYSEADQALFCRGGSQSYETSVVYADGSRREVLFYKAVFPRRDGRLGGLVGTMVDITERKDAEAKARYLAHFDPLTDLPNHVLFTDRINLAIAHAHRLDQRFTIFCLDLDHFKKINNAYGHPQGDKLLKKVGDRIFACLREDDTVARMGGDSFNLLLPQIGSEERAAKVAQKVLDSLKLPFDLDDRNIFVTASIGVALYPYDGQDASTLLKNADIALQRAKERGRNSHYFFDPAMNIRAEEQMALELQLRRAVEGNEFTLHFQPQVDTVSGRLIGAEALVRWCHPEMGLVMPDRFIPLAEQTGLIIQLGEWVLRSCCLQAREWQQAGQAPLRMAVNISPRQFQRPDLCREIDAILKETGLDPECLGIEVTESVIMQDVDHAIETLVRLKDLGVHLAIDDFGTGYSSLSYLKRFPIDLLKIDRSFIMDIPAIPDDIAIVSAVIAMAHQLNIKVLAEGVQSIEQRDFLLSHRCDELQGYLFARPLPADDFFKWHNAGR
jgi:diguanylate cyclase (GGDEF)-like protein/PAS domain S-box-containing protein